MTGALERQAERVELVAQVEKLRAEPSDNSPGKANRSRIKTTKTDAEVFERLEEWFGEKAHTLSRSFKKLTDLTKMTAYVPLAIVVPLALVVRDGRFEIEIRDVFE